MQRSIIKPKQFPQLLREISDPPKRLYTVGKIPDPDEHAYVAVVGTRKHSHYGRDVCEKIITDLAKFSSRPLVIVSGLALGIDAIAHKAALDNNLLAVAIPGSGLDEKVLHPRSNHNLARKIVNMGGAIASEYPWEYPASVHTFPTRNRIIAGLSLAVVVIESRYKSGALITARLALEYNRDVFAVPGSIFSETSEGPNMLISQGATPIISGKDILRSLNIPLKKDIDEGARNLAPLEQEIYDALGEPMTVDDLVRIIGKRTHEITPALTMMQVNGVIRDTGGELRRA